MSGLGSLIGTIGGGLLGGPTGAALGGALLGGLGGSSSGSATSTQSSQPWWGVQPYLTGANGIYPQAQTLYQQNGWSPGMDSATKNQMSALSDRMQWQPQNYNNVMNDFLSGKYNPNITPASTITAPTADFYKQNMASPVSAQGVSVPGALSSMGAVDPTHSISQMLTGQVNTSALDPVMNNAMRRLGENFNEQVMPGINQGAIAAGQYGGSRQGVAQGLAAKGLGYSMSDMASNMYNNAFNTAQGNMYGTANNMAGLGLNNAQANANRDLQAQQFNAGQLNNMLQFGVNTGQNAKEFNSGVTLNNNAQNMQAQNQAGNNQLQGLNVMNSGNNSSDANYAQSMGLFDAPNSYNWNNLSRFNSMIQPTANLGGTTTASNPYFTNPASSILGGALGGAQLYGLMNGGNTGLLPTPGAYTPQGQSYIDYLKTL